MESGTAMSDIAGVFEGSCRTNVLQFNDGSNQHVGDSRAGPDRSFSSQGISSSAYFYLTSQVETSQRAEDLHKLRCDISRLVELAYPADDPPEILNRTARDFLWVHLRQ